MPRGAYMVSVNNRIWNKPNTLVLLVKLGKFFQMVSQSRHDSYRDVSLPAGVSGTGREDWP